MMQKYGTLVIVLIVAVSAWLAGLPGSLSKPVRQSRYLSIQNSRRALMP